MAWLAFGLPLAALSALTWLIVRHKTGKRTRRSFTEITVNETAALFYGTKRRELDHRDEWSMMRDEEAQGAPPVDLDGGTWHVAARVTEK
jgi:chromosome condensin MukBEF complex kleisin-like MukF subunit